MLDSTNSGVDAGIFQWVVGIFLTALSGLIGLLYTAMKRDQERTDNDMERLETKFDRHVSKDLFDAKNGAMEARLESIEDKQDKILNLLMQRGGQHGGR